jgi:carboxymethylenebutenolidase
MCEQDDLDEFARRAALTRRQFGVLALGASLAAVLPRSALAAETVGADVSIKTPDGVADAYFVHPVNGTHPGVLMWPDIFGLRPAFRSMAAHLAESGYAVLVVNPFYRTHKAPTAPEHPDFNDPPTREALMTLMHTLTPATAESAAANGQFRVSRTCCSISTAIMTTRPPPSRAGVMKKPSDSTKTSTEPAKMPFKVSGT